MIKIPFVKSRRLKALEPGVNRVLGYLVPSRKGLGWRSGLRLEVMAFNRADINA